MDAATLLEDHMKISSGLLSLLVLLPLCATAEQYITIIQGLDGNAEYGKQFNTQSEKLLAAATSVTGKDKVTLLNGDAAGREQVLAHFDALVKSTKPADRLTVFLVGHGSYDGLEYKFNIPGPDLTGEDLATLLKAQQAKQQIIVNLGSSSGATQALLKADKRTVITATRNGEERLATRFGSYFASALEDSAADINKNEAVSLQEAFDYASRMVKDYFESQGQLASEHAVMEGGQAAQLVLARMGKRPAQGADPELVQLAQQREQLDISIEQLQLRKADMAPEQYMNELQQLMIDLSLVQDRIDSKEAPGAE